MSLYDATQQQRYIERQIWRWKREASVQETKGLGSSAVQANISERKAAQRDFIGQPGLSCDFCERAGGQYLGGSINCGKFKSGEDFLYKALGSAYTNNKVEVDEIIRIVTSAGGKVELLDDGRLYYNASASAGSPGEIRIDINASIGAWRHEYRHFLDDKTEGFPGLTILPDPRAYWEREYNGYMEEFRLAKSLKKRDIMHEIVAVMRERRNEIYGER